MNADPKVVARFFAKTQPGPVFDGTPCLLWTASRATRSGQGRFSDGQRFWVARRYAYTLQYGAIPAGMQIGHRCPNKLCVNHLHLEAITPAEVSKRAQRSAQQSRLYQLACNHGHLWTRENTYTAGQSGRKCRECQRAQTSRWRQSRAKRIQGSTPTSVYRIEDSTIGHIVIMEARSTEDAIDRYREDYPPDLMVSLADDSEVEQWKGGDGTPWVL